jgi:hypothetical protein
MNAAAQLIPDDGIEPLEQLDEKRDRIFRRLQKRTERILRKRIVKKAVMALAAELLKRKTMDGAEVHAIVDPILAPKVQ